MSGDKKEEYRELKKYWHKRFEKEFTHIKFVNGYGSDKPNFIIELNKIIIGLGNNAFGAPLNEEVYILELGEIVG